MIMSGRKLTKSKAIKVMEMIESGSTKTEALLKAGFSESTIRKKNIFNTDPLLIEAKSEFQKLMILEYPDIYKKTIRQIAQGLEANRQISAIVTSKEAGAATTDFIEVPDHSTRHKYVTTILDMQGELNRKPETVTTNVLNIGQLINLVRESERERTIKSSPEVGKQP